GTTGSAQATSTEVESGHHHADDDEHERSDGPDEHPSLESVARRVEDESDDGDPCEDAGVSDPTRSSGRSGGSVSSIRWFRHGRGYRIRSSPKPRGGKRGADDSARESVTAGSAGRWAHVRRARRVVPARCAER